MTAVVTELSAKVGSAPVLMLNMNIQSKSMIPKWAEIVHDIKKDIATQGQPSGRKIVEGRKLDLAFVLDDIDKRGYIPLRLVVVERFQGITYRMCLVCVHKDSIKGGDKRMPRRQEVDMRALLAANFWDARVYRNPGELGGNFIIEAGNPKSAKKASASADLRISNADEFELIAGDTPKPEE